jgi:Dienelactone hydrolase and related enzymes
MQRIQPVHHFIIQAACMLLMPVMAGANPMLITATLQMQTAPPRGYLAKPKINTSVAVLVLHDNLGLDNWIKSLCDSLAHEGFMAFAVDMYSGKLPEDMMEAHELERALPEDTARQNIINAAQFLKETYKLKHIGLFGIAMGGMLALDIMMNQKEKFEACVVNYAPLPTADSLIKQLSCPVMIHVGEKDFGIERASVEQFTQKMQALHKNIETHFYREAGFGFLRPNHENFHATSAREVWQRSIKFLKTYLLKSSQ